MIKLLVFYNLFLHYAPYAKYIVFIILVIDYAFAEKHKETNHQLSLKLDCLHCESKLTSRISLYEHTAKFHSESLFRCKLCPEAYVRKRSLESHSFKKHNVKLTTDRDTRLPCAECGRVFRSEPALTFHLAAHAAGNVLPKGNAYRYPREKGETPRNHVCVVCGFRSVSKCKLDLHMALHTTERPFPCTQCDKKFKTEPSLKKHILECHSEKTIPCPYPNCKLFFVSNYQRNSHLVIE